MTIEAGQQLLHYRVIEKIGEGGMGVVWRAGDTSLDRDVAIKVLPALFAGDADRLARFEREAKSLAALNHPNVASLFGLHEVDGIRFITMEYIEGEDLAKRIARGALPPAEAVAIAVGVAEALAAAHAQGIVHRDLKPANVLLDAEGTPKVLDFGLAKNAAPEAASGSMDPGTSPTVTSLGTVAGVLLGTAAYMSPEQARGKSVDRRTDTWALGCILFEMLAGKPLFAAETISDTLAGVLRSEPDWDALPATTPPGLIRILERCLSKHVRDRWQDAGDLRYELERALDSPEAATDKEEAPRRSRILPTVVLAVAALALGLLAGSFWRKPAATPEQRTTVSELSTMTDTLFDFTQVDLALSPDGEKLAYAAIGADGTRRLYVRSLSSGTLKELPGTTGATEPFWSPDGQQIAFRADAEIKRMGLNDTEPRKLVESSGTSGTWNSDGLVLFCSYSSDAVQAFDIGSGRLSSLDFSATAKAGCDSVEFLPDGDHFLFESRDYEGAGLLLGSIRSETVKPLIDLKTNAVYSSGHILYHDGPRLLARPFDTAALEFTGDPIVVADPVFEINFPFHALFTAARDRPRVVYLEGTGESLQTELVWFDRQGEVIERTGIVGDLYNPRLSRDGRRLLLDVSTYETEGDIWYFDLTRGSSRRLTDHPVDESRPVWSPDEKTAYFFRIPDLYRIDLSGSGDAVLLHGNENSKSTSDVSAEGILLYDETTEKRSDIGYYDPESGTATIWLATAADEDGAEFSPDGKWLVYKSDESGRPEIYIDRFPDRGERFRISSGSGHNPSWSADGTEIFYISSADELVAVPVDLQSGGRPVGEPQVLFRTRFRYWMFDPHPDGQRFLVVSPVDPTIDRAVLLDGWVRE